MRPENGNTQQMQQELQRKLHGKLLLLIDQLNVDDLSKEFYQVNRKQWASHDKVIWVNEYLY